MSVLNVSFAIAEKRISLFDELIYLRSIIDSANNQFKKIVTYDALLNTIIEKIIVLNNEHLLELNNDLFKNVDIPIENVVSVIKIHKDAFENSLHLLTLIINNYRNILANPTTNFTTRKKLQNQLNKLLYGCLQIKLLRSNPDKIPYSDIGQLF